MKPIKMQRLGIIMQPESELEVEGVLNPAVARSPGGDLYLFPRMVARGNYSRIGVTKVNFKEGNPVSVERMGIALEPQEEYEKRPEGGGCEDPRITFVASLGKYFMTYTAFSPKGARIAIASSTDLISWQRLGLADFAPYEEVTFNEVNNKDACIFPAPVTSPDGKPSLAMLHRPLFPGTRPEELMHHEVDRELRKYQECIWIAYSSFESSVRKFELNTPLALPRFAWENVKIGAGTPPILTKFGYLIVYHGVSRSPSAGSEHPSLSYSAGIMILDQTNAHQIKYRSPEPVLSPDLPSEKVGTIANVVFPTGIDERKDLGELIFDVYYGMADNRIAVARLTLPPDLI